MSISSFFNPKSIAVVGVSSNPKKVGYLVAKNLLDQGYHKNLYFLNPKSMEILGKKTYEKLSDIKSKIDLVVLATPAKVSIGLLSGIASINCKNVVMFAAGFAETGSPEGKKLNQYLIDGANKYGLNILGPNCIGFINTAKKINATFLNTIPKKGNIGIISQSGALGSAILDHFAAKTHLGISNFISLGNKIFIDETDILQYLISDPATKVIGLYLEDVRNGQKFRKIVELATKIKPVVVLKSGRTKQGSQAAVSHTGSLVGDDDVFSAVLDQSGAIRADSFAEFEMLLKLFSLDAVPDNENILVLSNAGGMGVLLTDELISKKLNLVNLSEKTTRKLNRAFEDSKKITIHNPIDLLGDASAFDYEKAINLTMKEKNIGGVVVLLTPQANTEILETAKVLKKIFHKKKYKSLYPIFMGKKSVSEAHRYFEKNGIASFRYFAQLPQALAKIINAKKAISNLKSGRFSDNNISIKTNHLKIKELISVDQTGNILNQRDSLKVLKLGGISAEIPYLVAKKSELSSLTKKLGFPLVAKVASDKITHKTEVNGVVTGITVKEELVQAYDFLSKLSSDGGCYIQKELKGHELILGAKRDRNFDIVIIIGIGGIYTELIRENLEVVFPWSLNHLKNKIENSKLARLTSEFRNKKPINLKLIHQAAQNLGSLMENFLEISEIDINPIICEGDKVIAVDSRIVLL